MSSCNARSDKERGNFLPSYMRQLITPKGAPGHSDRRPNPMPSCCLSRSLPVAVARIRVGRILVAGRSTDVRLLQNPWCWSGLHTRSACGHPQGGECRQRGCGDGRKGNRSERSTESMRIWEVYGEIDTERTFEPDTAQHDIWSSLDLWTPKLPRKVAVCR